MMQNVSSDIETWAAKYTGGWPSQPYTNFLTVDFIIRVIQHQSPL
jgi:hypothetical protein